MSNSSLTVIWLSQGQVSATYDVTRYVYVTDVIFVFIVNFEHSSLDFSVFIFDFERVFVCWVIHSPQKL